MVEMRGDGSKMRRMPRLSRESLPVRILRICGADLMFAHLPRVGPRTGRHGWVASGRRGESTMTDDPR